MQIIFIVQTKMAFLACICWANENQPEVCHEIFACFLFPGQQACYPLEMPFIKAVIKQMITALVYFNTAQYDLLMLTNINSEHGV